MEIVIHGAFLACAMVLSGCTSTPSMLKKDLFYTENTKSYVPVPAAELNLPTAVADKFLKISDKALGLESPVLDRDGNIFCQRL